jgi:transcriptional regulator with XRE-family HTH domain
MDELFGARLRQHRERQGISLAAIAEQTKIKSSLLDGLERGDLSQWPAGLFRRAYVRSYANAIGMDPDAVVREFLNVHPEPVDLPLPEAPQPRLRGFFSSALQSLSRGRGAPAPSEPVVAEANGAVRATGTIGQSAPALAEVEPSLGEGAERVSRETPAAEAPRMQIDLLAAARVCTELGRVEQPTQVLPLLREAARILDARGLIVWVWDAFGAELRPALVHGYSPKVLSKLPPVPRDADNLTAEAFRACETRAIDTSEEGTGALVVPLLTPAACAGVLAIELRHGSAEAEPVKAVATFLAAMLAQLIAVPVPVPVDEARAT